MYNLNNPILLLHRHLVIARQAEPSPEDVRADVDAGTGEVGIGFASAVTFHRDEGIGAIDGLHMH